MRNYKVHQLGMALAISLLGMLPVQAGEKPPETTIPVQKTVTVRVLGDDKRTPEINLQDVIVKQGNDRLHVTGWTPAQGEQAGLDLFILIDDASNQTLGSQYDDLRSFINSQPATTLVGLGYMQNGTVRIAQDFTSDHGKVAKALRLPLGYSGAFGSPYLSVIDLMKRWPETSNRHEVIMITDGIDRARRVQSYRGFIYLSPDVYSASTVAQRTGTMIHTIYTRGVGRLGRNFWEITNGQNSMAKLSEETGGESYFLGTTSPVSMKPYLDDLQKTFDSQYLLEFHAVQGKKSGLQSVKLDTPVAGVELNTADNVWVNAK